MIGLVAFAASVWLGFSILRLGRVPLTPNERLVAAPVLGVTVGFWFVYLASASIGHLSAATIGALVAGAALAHLAARARPWSVSGSVDTWFLRFVLVALVAVAALNLFGVMARGPNGQIVAAEHIWADTPFHASQVTAFAFRDNFPPTHTIAYRQPLNYPFLVNFVSGVLLRFGVGLRDSFILVNVFMQLTVLGALAAIALRLTGSRRAALLAAVLFFFLGNFGFLAVPQDVRAAGGFWEWLRTVPWSYTGDALGGPGRERLGTGVYLGNPVYIYLLPERSSAYGMAAGSVLFLLLHQLVRERRAGTAVVAGLLLGVMPRIQVHVVIIALAVAGVWFLLLPWLRGSGGFGAWRREWLTAAPAWLLAVAVAAAIALPQVAAESRQATGDFISLWLGWAGEPHDAFVAAARAGTIGAWLSALATFVRFWVLNGGLLLVLVVPAWLRAGRELRLWYAPFAALWLFANVVKTQPWEWDQNNFFFYWQLASVVLVAPWLVSLWDRDPSEERPPAARRALVGVMVAMMTVGGLLSYVYWAEHRYGLWGPGEQAFAQRVRELTPLDAAVLTSNGHTHPVMALSGRQGFEGFPGWVSVHNLDEGRLSRQLRAMYSGDVGLMRDLGIGYVVIGPWERGYARDERIDLPPAFDDPSTFEVVHETTIDGQSWKLLRLRPLSELTATPAR